MERYKSNFTEESLELVTELEKYLLLLESDPANRDLIEEVFRLMHTIKGNSAMFGYQPLADFTHHLETIYEYIRSNKHPLTKAVLDITLKAADHLSWLIQRVDDPEFVTDQKHQSLLQGIAAFADGMQDTPVNSSYQHYKITFAPQSDFFYNGANPLVVLKELTNLGECDVQSDLTNVLPLESLDPVKC